METETKRVIAKRDGQWSQQPIIYIVTKPISSCDWIDEESG
jgi:hypothetical protein